MIKKEMENLDINGNKEQDKNSEKKEHFLEEILRQALIKGVKLNEGNDGVILEINVEDLPPEAEDYFFTNENEKNSSLIAKTLKIFLPGSIAEEFRNNKDAYDLVQSEISKSENKGKFAKVVRPYFYKELEIKDDFIKGKIEKLGVRCKDKVSIMVEDYINGENFSLYVFKKIMDKMPALASLKKEVLTIQKDENLDQEDENIVRRRIFSNLGIKRNVLNDEHTESVRIAGELERFMKEENIIIDKEIINRVVNTVNLLNENGIYHNDLHERNIMLKFDDNGELIDVFIIDFGKASRHERLSTDTNVIKGYEDFAK